MLNVTCFHLTTSQKITSYKLVKTEKYVNNKLVEGFQNQESDNEDSSDEYST